MQAAQVTQVDEPRVILARAIVRLRAERGWSQQQLADAANIQRPKLSLYERGIPEVNTITIGKLARAFDVPVSELFL